MTSIKVALLGNPNTGKSSLFNSLTGMSQKVGNFPGITVDKKVGHSKLSGDVEAEVLDLPGTYSLYPKSYDERIVFQVLSDVNSEDFPDVVVLVVDATNLKRNLLLFSQVADLKIPVILVLNMIDLADKNGLKIQTDTLSETLGVRVISISARQNKGIQVLKEAILNYSKVPTQISHFDAKAIAPDVVAIIQEQFGIEAPYAALQMAHQYQQLSTLTADQKNEIQQILKTHKFNSQVLQAQESQIRFQQISKFLLPIIDDSAQTENYRFSDQIDRILTHKVWGFVLFLLTLFFIFNAIFSWSTYPMDLIEQSFLWVTQTGHEMLPSGVLTDLLLDGIVAGLSGIVVFVPQIAILFAFISLLEDTGYMARVTYMMDKLMRKVGLSGKSVVPIIGGLACAVPSIMSTRTIENWKDRLITIMVTPLISCSARLPVYTLLISVVIPSKVYFGFISLQGITLMCLYLISIISAVLVAWVMKLIIKTGEKNYFIMELPIYRWPRWKNVFYTVFEKSKTFVLEAGKVIIAISIVLWVLASYGPQKEFQAVDAKYDQRIAQSQDEIQINQLERERSSQKLEHSYAGILGHIIEPVIRPLGFDWKIGIALITSFAAREAFVGTMATIYSVDGDSELVLTEKLRNVKHKNGTLVYTFASGLALMLFYAFAMQCMSTVAIVKRETKSWKWPLIQVAYMTVLAYFAALIAFQLLK